jgi:hypothetical protein
MLCRVTVALAMAAFVQVAGAGPKPAGEEKPALYLPTTVGDKRVVELSANGRTAETTEWVTGVETKGGITVVSFSREEGGRTINNYRVSKDGLFNLSAGGFVLDPPLQMLKLPPKEGETWEVTSPAPAGKPAEKFKYTTGKQEDVEVPAGKFKAVRVELEETLGGATRKSTFWYAPGVGMVKTVTRHEQGDLVQQLKSFTPARK